MAIHETRAVIWQGGSGEGGIIAEYQEAADAALKHMHEMWQHSFAAKPVEWRYEKERRLLVDTESKDRTPILRPYPRKAVAEIIVGERMPSGYRERLTAIVKRRFGDIPVRTARLPSDRYTLIIE